MATTTKRDTATHEEYLQLHRWMSMAKALDDRMHILVKQGRAPFVGSSRGHEGIQVASTAAIGPRGWLVPHYRGLATAIVRGLPVVFVCENNGYAISVPIRLQMSNPDVADRARGYGIVGVTVDGTDVPAAYAVCKEAVERARRGEGPTLIDAKIWRINSHTSEDNQLKYRSKEEIEDAAEHDPIERFRSWLVERGWITIDDAARIQTECDQEASAAADWAEQQPDPVAEDALTNLFA